MRFGLLISSLLHASLLLLVAFGLPFLQPPPPPAEQPLLLELVTIDEVTTPQTPPTPEPKPVVKAEAPKAAEPEPAKEEKPLPPPPNAPAAPPPPKLALAPPPPPPAKTERPAPAEPPKPAKAEEPPPPPPMPTLEKKPPQAPEPPKVEIAAPKPKPKPETAEPPPQPEAKPKLAETRTPQLPKVPTPPAPEQKFEKTMDRIALLLDKTKREPAPERPPTPKPERRAAPVGPQASTGGQEQKQLTIREIDALILTIKQQIQRCWIVPAGARDAERLVVRLAVMLNRDGSLARPPVPVDNAAAAAAGGTFYRTAVESARRAVLECTPLRDLPPDSYDYWRENTLIFDPREILGR